MKKRNKTSEKKPADIQNDHTTIGHGRNVNDGRSMKTSEQVVDGGNMEDRDDPVANSDSPVLIQNISDQNLSTDKKNRK